MQSLNFISREPLLIQPIEPPIEPEHHPQTSALVAEAATLEQGIEDAAARRTCHEQLLDTLQSESTALLTQDAAPAMDMLLVLVHRIESLHQVTQSQKTSALLPYRDPTSAFGEMQALVPLVNTCRSQSRIVSSHFRSLSERARNLRENFTELTTDITFEISLGQERIGRLQNMAQAAKALQSGMEQQRESWYGQMETAEEHIQQARGTIRSAKSKRGGVKSARAVRNLLTLGLGEVFDLFDLNEKIGGAQKTLASAYQNVRAYRQSIQRAMAALQQINVDVERLDSLGHMVDAQEKALQESVTHGQALRTHTIDLSNASLEVSLFVGTLAAKSETLATHRTAQQFAEGVLNFGKLMALDGRLNGLLLQQNPGALQDTLDLIARSDPINDVAVNGWIVGTPQPQFAIKA